MVRLGIVAALLLAGSACRADEGLGAVPPAAPVVGPAPCCGVPVCGGGRHKLIEWLSYRPLTRPGLCGCCKQPVPCCRRPLYAWFVDYCQAAHGPAWIPAAGAPAAPCGPGCR